MSEILENKKRRVGSLGARTRFLKERKETEIAIIGHNSFIGKYKDNEIGLIENGKEELLHCYPYKVEFK